MATGIAATGLFRGPDLGVTDNVVLRHDNGIITDILKERGLLAGLAPSSFLPSSTPMTTRARPRRPSGRSACPSKAGSCAPRSVRPSIPI
ncbi:hypothetical protein ACQ5SK_39230 [Bradyrhizobium japonicum]